jgi:hypothetical protein
LRRYGILRCDRLWFRFVHPLEIFAAGERKLIVRVVRFEQEEAFTTGSRVSFLSILCCFGLAGCGPSPGTSAGVIPRPIVTTTPPLGSPSPPAQPDSHSMPPEVDRYGNSNNDSSGAYIGAHAVGTLVDKPDASVMAAPKVDMPDMSTLHCTGSSISKAGTINCSSN